MTTKTTPTAPTPAPIDSAFADWQCGVRLYFDVIRSPGKFLIPPPSLAGGDHQERLQSLMLTRDSLEVADWAKDPARETGNVWATRVHGKEGHAFDALSEAIRMLIQGIDQQIGALVAAGATHPKIIRTADFKTSPPWPLVQIEMIDGTRPTFFVGLLSHLPADHALQTLLPPEQLYRCSAGFQGSGPSIVLCQGIGNAPRSWVLVSEAVRNTGICRRPQAAADDERQYRDRMEAERERLARWNSEEQVRRREVEKILREQGLVPTQVECEP